MILTVISTTNTAKDQWQAELLEHSWQQVGQSGELVRLVACGLNEELPQHSFARVVRTRPWCPHPYVSDSYLPYNKPASILEWLIGERIDATLLLLDSDSVLLETFDQEIGPGQALAHTWREVKVGEKGPFGLPKQYNNLNAFCVNRNLRLKKVQYPLLIHSSDLIKILARWLELIGIIRSQCVSHLGLPGKQTGLPMPLPRRNIKYLTPRGRWQPPPWTERQTGQSAATGFRLNRQVAKSSGIRKLILHGKPAIQDRQKPVLAGNFSLTFRSSSLCENHMASSDTCDLANAWVYAKQECWTECCWKYRAGLNHCR